MYLFSLWPIKALSNVLCLSDAFEHHIWTCQDLFECWGQNCADLSLISTPLLTATVSVLFWERAR